ncbi:hypothetical protein FA95DRAFT_1683959 [Auriscalpium vulgare]|uniref:Uncharacterized protein n=1 Tax=Auriscalpium vulgare TaxID=40419 RepID=A0ACB8R863_9AGAM|nr:hypothetical protein FA95DRAFT_1683959 [Auriscalpium vulgare]
MDNYAHQDNSEDVGERNAVNVHRQISQLEDVPVSPPTAIHGTLESVETSAGTNSQAARPEQPHIGEVSINEAALVALHEHHNDRLPVARIPPEIIAATFTCLSAIDPPACYQESKYSSGARSSGWLAVTHVCRRWRQIAFGHASLWTNISLLFNRDWLTAFSTCSGKMPLTIEGHSESTLTATKIDFLVAHMSRTETLSLSMYRPPPDGPDIHHPALNTPAPLLRTLNLSLIGGRTRYLEWCAPALRALRVHSDTMVPVPWTSPCFTQITNLVLDGPGESIESILDGLPFMCALERLTIRLPRPLSNEVFDEGRRLAACPTLAHLELFGFFPRPMTLFLSHLLLPPHAVLRCRLPCFYDDLEALFPVALASIHSHVDSTSPITSLNMEVSDELAEVLLWNDGSLPYEPTMALYFRRDKFSADLFTHGVVRTVLRAFSSAHLTDLTLASSISNDILYLKDWRELIAHAPGVRRLTLEGQVAISFCKHLSEVITAVRALRENPSLALLARCFPAALSVLVIADVSLGVDSVVRQIGQENEGERMADALRVGLVERAAAGYNLQELDVVDCDVSATWVTKMREALPGTRVMWDEDAGERGGRQTQCSPGLMPAV